MNASPEEIERRRCVALEAIGRSQDGGVGQDSVKLFIAHHLDEIDGDFWSEHCGTKTPSPSQVIAILVLQSHWGEDDEDDGEEGINNFDFSLPGDVTNYVISVSFDEDGEVDDIAMES